MLTMQLFQPSDYFSKPWFDGLNWHQNWIDINKLEFSIRTILLTFY